MGVGLPQAWHSKCRCQAFFIFSFRYACPPKISLLNIGGRYAFLTLGVFMNSYLVRIYRKADNNPRVLVGVVEEVGAMEKKAFSDLHELWDILNTNKKE
jgi:hypothetical protein